MKDLEQLNNDWKDKTVDLKREMKEKHQVEIAAERKLHEDEK